MATNLDHEERLKATVHYYVGKMCEEEGTKKNIVFSRAVIATINELVWRQLKVYTADLEGFAKHGKRTTISADDVKLLLRRNADLKAKVESALMPQTEDTVVGAGKNRLQRHRPESKDDFQSADF